jgi:hypothetical protein
LAIVYFGKFLFSLTLINQDEECAMIHATGSKKKITFILKRHHPMPWWDSISRPIVPVSLVAGRDNTTRPCR